MRDKRQNKEWRGEMQCKSTYAVAGFSDDVETPLPLGMDVSAYVPAMMERKDCECGNGLRSVWVFEKTKRENEHK